MKSIAKPAMSLTLICLVCAAALSLTNYFTKHRIEEQGIQLIQSSISELIPEAIAFGAAEECELENVGEAVTFYRAFGDEDELVAYAFISSAAGYGGEIELVTAIAADGKIIGVKLIKIAETPGLGMKAQENSFLSQFSEKFSELTVNKKAQYNNEIQAITGATITSAAVTLAVNKALLAFELI